MRATRLKSAGVGAPNTTIFLAQISRRRFHVPPKLLTQGSRMRLTSCAMFLHLCTPTLLRKF